MQAIKKFNRKYGVKVSGKPLVGASCDSVLQILSKPGKPVYVEVFGQTRRNPNMVSMLYEELQHMGAKNCLSSIEAHLSYPFESIECPDIKIYGPLPRSSVKVDDIKKELDDLCKVYSVKKIEAHLGLSYAR